MECAICPVTEGDKPHPLDWGRPFERLVIKKGLDVGVGEELECLKINALALQDINTLRSSETKM